MATVSERLAYILTFDTSQGVRSLQQFGKAADKEFSDAEKKLDKLGTSFTKIGAGAMAFAGVAGAGLFKLAMGAADAEANMAALEQVVGETVATDIGRWAENSARGVGLASKDAVSAATSFAQLGKIIGLGDTELSKFSTDLVGLSADFAAFQNVSPDQALQDIQAAFAGSTEVMRKYGIFLDDATLKQAYYRETGEQVTGTLTAQQKIVAINAELYRQGADMVGQWGRESGEAAGQLAIMKAELTNAADAIGAGVLPMVTDLLGTVTGLATGFASLSDATGGFIGKAAGVAVAGAAIGGAALFAAGKIIQLRQSIRETATRLSQFATSSPKAAAALGVASVAAVGFALAARDAAQDAQRLTENLQAIDRATDDAILDAFNLALADSVANGTGVNKVLEDLAQNSLGAAQRVVEVAEATGQETAATRALEVEIQKEIVARQSSTDSADAEKVALEGVTSALDDESAARDRAAESAQAYADAQKEAIDRIREAYEQDVSDAETWAEGINSAINGAAESFYSLPAAAETSMAQVTEYLAAQNYNVTTWQEDLKAIAERGGPDLAAALASWGPEYAGLIDEIANSAPEDFDRLKTEVTNQAGLINSDMQTEFDKIGPGLSERLAAAKVLMVAQMALMEASARSSGQPVGQGIAEGIGQGIAEGSWYINLQARLAVLNAVRAATAAADIHSPSRLFAEEVGAPIAEGIAEGIVDEADSISDALESSIEAAERDAIRAADELVKKASDRLGDLWGGLDDRRSRADMRESVEDAEQALAEARKKAREARRRVDPDLPDAPKLEDFKVPWMGGVGSTYDQAAYRKAVKEHEKEVARIRKEAEKERLDDIRQADEAVAAAKERLIDANYRLAKSSDAMLLKGAKAIKAWEEIARAGGLTTGQINAIKKAAADQQAAERTAGNAKKDVRQEASTAQKIREEFNRLVRAGFFGDQLDHIAQFRNDPGFQVRLMKELINQLSLFFGGVPKYANGTSSHPGGPAIVGERGAELLNLPRGASVTPLSKMAAQVPLHLHLYDGSTVKALINEHDAATLRGLRGGIR